MIFSGCGQTQTRPALQTPTTTQTAPSIQTMTTGTTNTSVTKNITLANFQFSPAIMEISPGETVTRTNNDTTVHTIVADDGSFKSTALQPGRTFSFTFNKAGKHSYHC